MLLQPQPVLDDGILLASRTDVDDATFATMAGQQERRPGPIAHQPSLRSWTDEGPIMN